MPADVQDETRVTEGHAASVPASVRRALDIEPGDILVWSLAAGRLTVRVKKAKREAFKNFRPYDIGFATDATAEHDEVL